MLNQLADISERNEIRIPKRKKKKRRENKRGLMVGVLDFFVEC